MNVVNVLFSLAQLIRDFVTVLAAGCDIRLNKIIIVVSCKAGERPE